MAGDQGETGCRRPHSWRWSEQRRLHSPCGTLLGWSAWLWGNATAGSGQQACLRDSAAEFWAHSPARPLLAALGSGLPSLHLSFPVCAQRAAGLLTADIRHSEPW